MLTIRVNQASINHHRVELDQSIVDLTLLHFTNKITGQQRFGRYTKIECTKAYLDKLERGL